MKKTLALAASLWLASPAAAQVNLKIIGSINGSTKASDYSGPAPTGPGMVFFNGVDVWPYVQQAPPPPPPSAETTLVITGSINGVTDGSNYKAPAPAVIGTVFFNGHDVWAYMHPTIPAPPSPTPTPIPAPAAAPAATAPNTITPPPSVAPQPSAAPITVSTATSVKTIAPAAAEARKKKLERLSRKLDALADKLVASKLSAAKKDALSARIKALSAQLKEPAGKLTPEAAGEAFTKLNDDFAEAKESAASKP